MDRRRTGSPVYFRQGSGGSSSTGSSSPSMSPSHHRSSSLSGLSGVRRTQNVAARAAAARLAQVMASQSAAGDDEDDDDDGDGDVPIGVSGFRLPVSRPSPAAGSNGFGGAGVGVGPGSSLLGRTTRSPSPALGRNFVEHAPSVRSSSTGRPSVSAHSTQMVPPSRTSLRIQPPIQHIEPPTDRRKERRFPTDMGLLRPRESGDQREASVLKDELDMLQEENENIHEKLRIAEQRCEEAEARARELEKQVANLGEGVSLEARLLNRKEAALRQREAALKAAELTRGGRDEEIIAIQEEVQSAKAEAATVREQLREAQSEAISLRSMTQRMILTQEEMEEVVLKRCWLARYWGLAVQHAIYPEIAVAKHEYWSSLAPLPVEVVLSAGQKAKEESWKKGDDSVRINKLVRDLSDMTGEGNIESMLLVEKGLRELASLKIEDAVILALGQHRRPNYVRTSTSDLKSPGDPKYMEAFELNQAESEDVFFKQAWLTYFWRRAKAHGVEEDIAEDRLQFWISHSGQSPTSHDAVDVERGLMELRKLGIEQLLWDTSRRREIDQNLSTEDAPEN